MNMFGRFFVKNKKSGKISNGKNRSIISKLSTEKWSGVYQKGVFMDANENPFGGVIEEAADNELNRYPDPYSRDLRRALGKFLGILNLLLKRVCTNNPL